MINRTQKELETLSNLIYGRKDICPDMTLIQVSSWKDPENNLHTFMYSEDDTDISNIRYNLGKIYQIFTDNKSMLYGFWKEMIDRFENMSDIDFFTLISYVFMNNKGTDSGRNAKVTSEVAFVLFSAMKGGK